jgi:uncharacterized protein with HEPN domain
VTSQGEREQLAYIARALARLTSSVRTGAPPFSMTGCPELPWWDIAAFRNRIVHGYLGVSMEVVWDIIAGDLPPITAAVAEELKSERPRLQPN